MATADTAKLIAELSFKDKLTPGVATALKSVDRLDKGLGRAGKGAGQLGMGLARLGAIGAGAAVAGIVGAGKAAIDFEDAFAGVKKTVDETDLSRAGLTFDKLKGQFTDLSTRIPITAVELARLGEAAGALGVKAQDITAFAEVTAKLGVTTDLTADQAAESLGKVGTILGITGQQYEAFGDILVNLGNKGASTESEILEVTKRFAGSGKAAGLSTAQILAYSSAITSAGVNEEAGGSSLSRLFSNLVTNTANGTDKAKEFAKVSGTSFKDFSKIVKTDTNAAMLLFLKNLGKLDKFEASKALKAVGITGVNDRNAIVLLSQTYEQNLIPALKNAADATGALDKESAQKFDTIKSKWQLLKNAFTKGGIEVGEGFLPALGRLTTKVTAWVNTNSGKLQQLGRDIGKSIDDINWSEVESGAKRVGDAARTILDLVKQIPTEVKLGGLAFLGLDKASGGLLSKGLGNIGGGVGGALFDRFLARGASPANPLWVQSVGVAGPGGKPGLPGVTPAAGLLGIGLAPVFAAVAAAAAQQTGADQFNQGLEKGAGIKSNFTGVGAGPASIIPAIGNLTEAIRVFGELNKPKPPPAPPKPAVTHTPTTHEARAGMPEYREWLFQKSRRITTAVENLRSDIGKDLSQTPTKLDAVKAVVDSRGIEAALASKNAGDRSYTGALAGAGVVARAVERNRTIVNVDSRTIIDSRTYNSSINRETTYINGGYNGGAPQGGR